MTCDDFTQWLESAGAKLPEDLPEAHAAHIGSCAACRAALEEEQLWRRFFSAAPAPPPQRPAWPGVLARIREEEGRRASWSDALLLFSRRLAPAFALVVVLLGGVGLWRGMLTQPLDRTPASVTMLEGVSGQDVVSADEPDAVLIAWVGDRNP